MTVSHQIYQKIGPLHKCGAIDIYKASWTLPGHKYSGRYNDLESQVRYDPNTGEILESYNQQTRSTDAVAMQ